MSPTVDNVNMAWVAGAGNTFPAVSIGWRPARAPVIIAIAVLERLAMVPFGITFSSGPIPQVQAVIVITSLTAMPFT